MDVAMCFRFRFCPEFSVAFSFVNLGLMFNSVLIVNKLLQAKQQFCDFSFQPPVHLTDYRICPFQFASKQNYTVHQRILVTLIKILYIVLLRYRHQCIRLAIRNIGFFFSDSMCFALCMLWSVSVLFVQGMQPLPLGAVLKVGDNDKFWNFYIL